MGRPIRRGLRRRTVRTSPDRQDVELQIIRTVSEISVNDTNDEQFALGRLPKAAGLVERDGRAVPPSRWSTGRLLGSQYGTAAAEVREGVLES
ncbi:hypothetical protein GCM10020369_42270 [Cryptosporangium minutisporangium]|uniref:Uncharacterized protein n=1 Tax=Cryptosporangium minutisporangium TaxID=113569 RepID=A0ABP6T0F0_9ACTN